MRGSFFHNVPVPIIGFKNQIKSSLYSLNTLSVSQVSGAILRGFAPRPMQLRLQRWRVVGNVWEIWSARDLNVLSGRYSWIDINKLLRIYWIKGELGEMEFYFRINKIFWRSRFFLIRLGCRETWKMDQNEVTKHFSVGNTFRQATMMHARIFVSVARWRECLMVKSPMV